MVGLRRRPSGRSRRRSPSRSAMSTSSRRRSAKAGAVRSPSKRARSKRGPRRWTRRRSGWKGPRPPAWRPPRRPSRPRHRAERPCRTRIDDADRRATRPPVTSAYAIVRLTRAGRSRTGGSAGSRCRWRPASRPDRRSPRGTTHRRRGPGRMTKPIGKAIAQTAATARNHFSCCRSTPRPRRNLIDHRSRRGAEPDRRRSGSRRRRGAATNGSDPSMAIGLSSSAEPIGPGRSRPEIVSAARAATTSQTMARHRATQQVAIREDQWDADQEQDDGRDEQHLVQHVGPGGSRWWWSGRCDGRQGKGARHGAHGEERAGEQEERTDPISGGSGHEHGPDDRHRSDRRADDQPEDRIHRAHDCGNQVAARSQHRDSPGQPHDPGAAWSSALIARPSRIHRPTLARGDRSSDGRIQVSGHGRQVHLVPQPLGEAAVVRSAS